MYDLRAPRSADRRARESCRAAISPSGPRKSDIVNRSAQGEGGIKNLIAGPAKSVKIACSSRVNYYMAMFDLSRQQQLFLCVVLLLLLTGWAVKAWRTIHPPARQAVSAGP